MKVLRNRVVMLSSSAFLAVNETRVLIDTVNVIVTPDFCMSIVFFWQHPCCFGLSDGSDSWVGAQNFPEVRD